MELNCTKFLLLSNLGIGLPRTIWIKFWTSQKEIDRMVLLCCIDTWEGLLMISFVLACYFIEERCIGNHQFSQDWNDILHFLSFKNWSMSFQNWFSSFKNCIEPILKVLGPILLFQEHYTWSYKIFLKFIPQVLQLIFWF